MTMALFSKLDSRYQMVKKLEGIKRKYKNRPPKLKEANINYKETVKLNEIDDIHWFLRYWHEFFTEVEYKEIIDRCNFQMMVLW